MPLQHSSSPSAFKTNVRTLMGEVGSKHVGSRDQALAIAYAIKRRGRAEGGAADDPLASVLAGRDQDNPYAGKLASILTDIGSGVAGLIKFPRQAMEQGVTTSEAVPWAAKTGLAMVGTPGVPRGALGSALASPERIERAAINIGGKIYAGPNHAAAIRIAEQSTGKGFDELIDAAPHAGNVDGFLTSHGRFVSREEAADMARHGNMLRRPDADLEGGLMTEDVRKGALWALPTAGVAGGVARDNGRAFGGMAPTPWQTRSEARSMMHTGPISSIVPGRTDRHNMNVPSGSYVMPADAVSHLGQNNSMAGQAVLSHMFGSNGMFGRSMPIRHGAGAPRPPGLPKRASGGMSDQGGGRESTFGQGVPIKSAGGEFVIPVENVHSLGGGDVNRGHQILDQWVLKLRKDHQKTLRQLPPPAKK